MSDFAIRKRGLQPGSTIRRNVRAHQVHSLKLTERSEQIDTSALSPPKIRVGGFAEINQTAWNKEVPMQKKYIVHLTDQERKELAEVVRKLKGTSQKVRRALILLKADAGGPSWTDRRIAEAFGCRTKTVENVRQRLVERGFEETLNGAKPTKPPTNKLLDGEQEARIIATRLGSPPKGYANWTLRLLARRVVELEIVNSVSHETIRRTLKKTA
jgi:hypothetical protein